MNPDKCLRMNAFPFQNLDLPEGWRGKTRVRGNGQSGFQVGAGRRADQFLVHLRKLSRLHADFHEARPDFRPANAFLVFPDPAGGELVGGFGEGVRRQEFVLHGSVITGIGHDLQAAFIGQAFEQHRVFAQI